MPYNYIFPNDVNLLEDVDALVIAGGFSYGDYLRPGAIASQTKVGKKLDDYVNKGHFVLGICNGFQILCELGILPGILTTNTSTKFISKWVNVYIQENPSKLLKGMGEKKIKIPIAHFEGRYYDEPTNILKLKKNKQVAFQYCNGKQEITVDCNPNGSVENIAGITNESGNVLGLMPHPERASFSYLGSDDGRIIFENLKGALKC